MLSQLPLEGQLLLHRLCKFIIGLCKPVDGWDLVIGSNGSTIYLLLLVVGGRSGGETHVHVVEESLQWIG